MPTFQPSQPPRILNDAFGAMIVRMVGIGLVFLTTTLAARHLGPSEYGIYNTALSIAVLLATLAPIGSDRLAARNLSTISVTAEAGREVALAHRCVAWTAGLIVSAAVVLLLILAPSGKNGEWCQIVILTILMFFPLTMTYVRQWIAIPVIGARAATFPEQTILPLLFLCVVALAVLLEMELNAVVAAVLYSAIAFCVWAFSFSRGILRRLAGAAIRTRVTHHEIHERMRSGMPFVGVSLGGVLLNRVMPLVVAAVLGFEDSGRFAVALQFAALPGIPLGVANLCMMPRCSRYFLSGQHSDAEHVVRQTATVTLAVSLCIAIAAWLLSPIFLLLLGNSYEGVQQILPVMLCVAVIEAAAGPIIAVLQAAKLEILYCKVTFAFVPIQLGLIGLAGHLTGIMGAAVTYLVSRTLWNLLLMVIIYRQRGIRSFPYRRVRQFRTMHLGGLKAEGM